MNQMYKKGISLLALIITIVVLVILTGVVIINSISENLLNNTEYSVEEYNRKIMVENIKNDIESKRMEKVKQGIYTLDYANDILNIINSYGTLDSNTLKVTINEPRLEIWLYEIVKIPLEEYSQITYEKGTLTIQTQLANNGYTVQYSSDSGTSWNRYTKTVTFTEESGIYVRLINEEGTVVSNTIKVTTSGNRVIDNIGPTVSITADTTDITNVSSITYTIIFNEPVVGFRTEDITVENGTKGTFTKINDIEYTIVVTNNTDCIQKVIVAEGVCTDVSGNLNSQGSKEININRTVPVVTISPNGSSSVKNINVIITASGANELKTDNEYKYCLTTNKTLDGTEIWETYTSGASFTIGTGLDGIYYIHTKKIYDIAGNESTEVTSNPFVFDNTAPTCTIVANSTNVKSGSDIKYIITFSESVEGLETRDITVVGGTRGTLIGSEKIYELTVTNSIAGIQKVTLTANSCVDSAGNGNEKGEGTTIISAEPNYEYLYYVGVTDTSSWIGYGNDTRSISNTNGLSFVTSGTGSSSVGRKAGYYTPQVQLTGWEGLGFLGYSYNEGLSGNLGVAITNVGGYHVEGDGSWSGTCYLNVTPGRDIANGNYLTLKDTNIEYTGILNFYLSTWWYSGTTGYIRCAFVYKLDDRTLLQTGLGINSTELTNLVALDSNTWTTVLSNETSVNYLLNNVSGDIMFKAVGNSAIRGLITSSTYASDFSNNEHWGPILTLCQNNSPTLLIK